jgi:uncharacterized membrane protein YqjE
MYQESRVRQLREKPMGELFGELSREMSGLVRDEVELAKVEMTEKAKKAGIGAGIIAGGAVVALGAFGALTAFFIMVLGLVMATWLAALIVFVVYAAIAAVLVMVGRNRLQRATPPVPQETVETLREDVQWAKRQV